MISLTISKRMLKFIGIYKWLYIISLFGGGICAGLRGGIFSIIYKNTFDSSINNIVVTKIILLIIGLLAIALLQRYFNFLFKYCNRHITSTLRIGVFEKLLSTRVCELEINNSGSIQSCLNNDIPALENIYSSKMSSLINTTLIGIVSICVIFILDYRLASVSIIFNVICCLINVKFIPELRRNNRINLESSSKLLQIISSVIYGNKEIKIFSIANHLYDAFNKLNIDNGKTIVDNSKISGIIDGIQLFVRNLTSVGILIIGLFLLFQNKITVGVIVAIMLQQDGISFMFSNFNNYINDLQKSLIGAERVFKLLDMEEEQYEINVYSKERVEFEYSVEFKNVDFRYEDKKVLRDVNLKVKKNNIVAIVGKSGSGKSTLLKLLMSFYRVEKGEIFIEGKDIKEYTLKDLRNKIAYVPQDSYLFNSTINENISYGSSDMEISQEDIINAAKMAGAHEFIMSLPDGYETKVGENSSNFSGGEKQRIAIARAFLKNAPILLLDEPTSALDKATEDIIKQSLLNLMEKRTVLIITHKMTTIDNIDYIYTINQSGFVDLNSGITKS